MAQLLQFALALLMSFQVGTASAAKLHPTCHNFWWFNASSTACAEKQFCGAYMYYGLHTFATKNACQAALPNSVNPSLLPTTCENLWWFNASSTVCSLKPFCGSYMYYGLHTFKARDACEAALPTSSAPVVPPAPSCQNLWWYNASSTACGEQKFCGAYMYYGLHTFTTKNACQAAFATSTRR